MPFFPLENFLEQKDGHLSKKLHTFVDTSLPILFACLGFDRKIWHTISKVFFSPTNWVINFDKGTFNKSYYMSNKSCPMIFRILAACKLTRFLGHRVRTKLINWLSKLIIFQDLSRWKIASGLRS